MLLYVSWKSRNPHLKYVSVTELLRSMILLPATLSLVSIHGQCQCSLVYSIQALLDEHEVQCASPVGIFLVPL